MMNLDTLSPVERILFAVAMWEAMSDDTPMSDATLAAAAVIVQFRRQMHHYSLDAMSDNLSDNQIRDIDGSELVAVLRAVASDTKLPNPYIDRQGRACDSRGEPLVESPPDDDG